MKNINLYFLGMFCLIMSFTHVFSRVEIIQRRHVAPENIDEFIERETTYWSEVAQKAIDDGKMAQWSLWQKVDGTKVDQDHNFIFINSFEEPTDLDHLDEIWDFKAVFPTKRPEQIVTSHLSTVKD